MRHLLSLTLALVSFAALAQEAEAPPLPRERPAAVAAEQETWAPAAATETEATAPAAETPAAEANATLETATDPATGESIPLPRERPAEADAPAADAAATPEAAPTADNPAAETDAAPGAEGQPAALKAPRIYQAACPAVVQGLVEAEMLPPIKEGICEERSPLSVTGAMSTGRMVPFTGAATTNCQMATALPGWIEAVDGYLQSRESTRIESVVVGTSYACRNRNNAATGDTSEHGFANAMDVVGFKLEDGRTMSLPDGWADALSPEGRLLRFAHDAACSRFTTTLGPEANAEHRDHLHIDMGCHGKTCTARLCE